MPGQVFRGVRLNKEKSKFIMMMLISIFLSVVIGYVLFELEKEVAIDCVKRWGDICYFII